MSSQASLISRTAAIERLLAEPVSISKAPNEVEHNEAARLLRNGLAVTLFAALEDFARRRVAELFLEIQGKAAFVSLPERLQDAATIGTLEAVAFRHRFEPRGSARRQFVQSQAGLIASTANNAYSVSPLAFLHGTPNIDDDDFASLLKCFGVDSPWQQIDTLAGRLGIGLPDTKQAFQNLHYRRNSAAHEASSLAEHAELLESIDAVVAIAISADLLLTHAARAIAAGRAPGMGGRPKLTADQLALRFLTRSDVLVTRWREIRENAKRAVRIYTNLDEALAESTKRAKAAGEHLVVSERAKRIVRWVS